VRSGAPLGMPMPSGVPPSSRRNAAIRCCCAGTLADRPEPRAIGSVVVVVVVGVM
jgi:hypothetical protein